jgi:hypothetical protein
MYEFNRIKKNPFEQKTANSKIFWGQKLTLWFTFWPQKLTLWFGFWTQKLTLWARETISSKTPCSAPVSKTPCSAPVSKIPCSVPVSKTPCSVPASKTLCKSMAKLNYKVQKEVATVGANSPGSQITNKRPLQCFRLIADTWKDYHMADLALVY